jgi:hypothetical protein
MEQMVRVLHGLVIYYTGDISTQYLTPSHRHLWPRRPEESSPLRKSSPPPIHTRTFDRLLDRPVLVQKRVPKRRAKAVNNRPRPRPQVCLRTPPVEKVRRAHDEEEVSQRLGNRLRLRRSVSPPPPDTMMSVFACL